MPIFKKKQPIQETEAYKQQEQVSRSTLTENVNLGRLPPLEPPKPPTLEEQLANTPIIEFQAWLVTHILQIEATLKRFEDENTGK